MSFVSCGFRGRRGAEKDRRGSRCVPHTQPRHLLRVPLSDPYVKGAPGPQPRPPEAMVGGLAHSGRVIFAVGDVMVAAFLTFALFGPMQPKQMGIMLGFAVVRDALLVRLMLVPILLRFTGRAAGGCRDGSTRSLH
jgi:hypothetical protein